MLQRIFLLALAGSIGTLARYGLSLFVQKFNPMLFPWGTFTINLLGCFAFGIIWSLAEDRMVMSSETRLILLTGFMGAFTTFSTFAFETSQLLRDSQWWLAAGNFAGQTVLGIVLMIAGLGIGRIL